MMTDSKELKLQEEALKIIDAKQMAFAKEIRMAVELINRLGGKKWWKKVIPHTASPFYVGDLLEKEGIKFDEGHSGSSFQWVMIFISEVILNPDRIIDDKPLYWNIG